MLLRNLFSCTASPNFFSLCNVYLKLVVSRDLLNLNILKSHFPFYRKRSLWNIHTYFSVFKILFSFLPKKFFLLILCISSLDISACHYCIQNDCSFFKAAKPFSSVLITFNTILHFLCALLLFWCFITCDAFRWDPYIYISTNFTQVSSCGHLGCLQEVLAI